jgi:RES domain
VSIPAEHYACPDPGSCPVTKRHLEPLRLHRVKAATTWYRVYEAKYGYDEHNPGFGNTRFAPLHDSGDTAIPSMYLAGTPTGALLETVFHDLTEVDPVDRIVSERGLLKKLLAHVTVPHELRVLDLRDRALTRKSIHRGELVTSPALHYPCTRRIARALHEQHPSAQGLIWHSRQAELAAVRPVEVLVVFGDRYPAMRGTWSLLPPGVQNLFEGQGRVAVERIVTALDATLELVSGP